MLQIIQHSYGDGSETIPGVGSSDGNNARADLIFVDPPYNIGIRYDGDNTRDRMDPLAYQSWCQLVMFGLSQHLRPGGTLWWLCPAGHSDWVGALLTKMIGPREYLVVKTETFAQYQQKTLTEDYRLLYCHRKPGGPLTFNPDTIRVRSARQEMGDKRADPRGRVPGQIWTIRRLQGTSTDRVDWHPCQLAPELLSRIVLGWTNPGDLVLDAFAGSGNMGIVCRATGRRFIGVDQSAKYCDLMRERLNVGQAVDAPPEQYSQDTAA